MTLCEMCLGLEIPTAIHRLQHTQGTGRPDDDEAGWMYGWHDLARDVFLCASTSKCKLCISVTQGWKEYRQAAITDSTREGMINPQAPPDDLQTDLQQISAYNDGKVQTVVLRLERGDDGRQRWSYALRVACMPEQLVEWDVHHELFAELKIAKDLGSLSSGRDLWNQLDMDWTVRESPISVESIKTARTWLETCIAKHSSCNQGDKPKMPTRFLDIGHLNDQGFVFLKESTKCNEESPTDPRYIALSHCWGTARTITTTQANIEAHKRGIRLEELPQTFKDAVQFAQKFELRYLWIDSLCIVQDDAADWEREAARMAEVYRDAHLVLGATRGESDAQGFLGPRLKVPGSVVFEGFIISLMPPLLQRWTTGVDMMINEPLSDRAWCLQERYLARRMLMYGSTQAAWECAELRASEDGESIYEEGDQLSRLLQTANTGISVFGDILPTLWNTDLLPRRRETVVRYADWYRMVEQYTTRRITKDSDRLPALLGVSNALKSITGDDYIMGIWLGGLLEGLAWCATNKNSLRHPRTGSGPSWSWASKKGPVQFPVYSWYEFSEGWGTEQVIFEPLAKYIGHSLTDGTLHLSAPVVAVMRHCQRPIAQTIDTEDWLSEPPSSPVVDTVFSFQHTDGELWVEGAFDIEPEDSHGTQLLILFLTRLSLYLSDKCFEHRLGLVFKTAGSVYERVGFIDSCVLKSEMQVDGVGFSKLYTDTRISDHSGAVDGDDISLDIVGSRIDVNRVAVTLK
ncbi:heterokaryon incompatibility protein-domain-containing protein [Hypoxylon crocopeplum]|nr:heterokaryon incompatibility protein-domain-containing protein [Hypoxylon crocopeplum]